MGITQSQQGGTRLPTEVLGMLSPHLDDATRHRMRLTGTEGTIVPPMYGPSLTEFQFENPYRLASYLLQNDNPENRKTFAIVMNKLKSTPSRYWLQDTACKDANLEVIHAIMNHVKYNLPWESPDDLPEGTPCLFKSIFNYAVDVDQFSNSLQTIEWMLGVCEDLCGMHSQWMEEELIFGRSGVDFRWFIAFILHTLYGKKFPRDIIQFNQRHWYSMFEHLRDKYYGDHQYDE